MKQEQKELLIKDLCARLPYGVKCLVNYIICNETTDYNDIPSSKVDTIVAINQQTESYFFEWLSEWFDFDEFKPYLFPLSSMTEEQEVEYDATFATIVYEDGRKDSVMTYKSFDWLNKNHFDYRDLIPMGLANDATGLNIY